MPLVKRPMFYADEAARVTYIISDAPALPNDNRILLEIAHVDRGTLVDDVRMLAHQEPAHVREEEASLRVVRIRIRVRKLVVDSMIPHPFVNMILQSIIK